MSKTKMMQFVDGLKEIKVGDSVVSDNGQYGQHQKRVHTYTVASIGNKLVTMSNGDKFFLETGKKQTNYTWGLLYSSVQEYEQDQKNQQIISEVKLYVSSYTNKITIEQALKIKEILGI